LRHKYLNQNILSILVYAVEDYFSEPWLLSAKSDVCANPVFDAELSFELVCSRHLLTAR